MRWFVTVTTTVSPFANMENFDPLGIHTGESYRYRSISDL